MINQVYWSKEITVFRGYVGRLMRLSGNMRPDLAFSELDLARKIINSTIRDKRSINSKIKRILVIFVVVYKEVDKRDNLKIIVGSDTSFSRCVVSVGGSLIMLRCTMNLNVSHLYWKWRMIKNTCTFHQKCN